MECVCVIAVHAGAHLGSDGGLSRSRAAVRCALGGTPDPLGAGATHGVCVFLQPI